MTVRRSIVSAALVTGLVLGVVAPVAAAPPGAPADTGSPQQGSLPPGWQLGTRGGRPALIWRAAERIPVSDAGVEFFAGERSLGRPSTDADGRTFRLDAPALSADDLAGLQVRAGNRRLDVTAPARRSAAPAPAVASPAVAPPATVDPGTPGRYATVSGEYRLDSVQLPGFPAKVEMLGVVVAPRGAPGPRPVVLFLHGRHDVCYDPADPDNMPFVWPCPAGTRPIPSHRGYLQAQRLLASQGYLTVSIAANGINGQDGVVVDGGAQARSSLVRAHLARWADWAGKGRATAPAVARAVPRADLSKVLLVGHSRGGEGVNRAATDSLTPPPAAVDGFRGPVRWKIGGTLLIGPTIFGNNPAPDVPSATILPGCDGDVSDLQGQLYLDATRGISRGTALHSALYVIGANHNFFNTEWTPGQAVAPARDDFVSDGSDPDAVCTPGVAATRLTPTQQQDVGATYAAAAARLFVAGDDRVRPLLDGSGVRAPSADPARVLSHAVGAARRPLLVPGASVAVAGPDGRLCAPDSEDPSTACLDPAGGDHSPHFVSFAGGPDPDRSAVRLAWSAPGGAVTLRPAAASSLAGDTHLALRVIVPPNTTGTRLGVVVTDTRGRRADLGEVRVDGLPATPRLAGYWAREVRVPLAAAVRAGVDPGRIAGLSLVPRSAAGRAWLIDAWGWRPGTPAARPTTLPRIDTGLLEVAEGDDGVRTFRVPITFTGRGTGRVRVYVTDPVTFEPTSRVVTMGPGTRRIEIPVRVTGNTLFNYDTLQFVAVKALQGAVAGAALGGARVHDDDPTPSVRVTPLAARVTEGDPLRWRVSLSTVAGDTLYFLSRVQAPATGPELSSTDVDPEWFTGVTGQDPLPSRPLSTTGLSEFVFVDPGELDAEVSVPTTVDQLDEPAEQLRLGLGLYPRDFSEPVGVGELTGTVTDRP